MSLVSFLDYFTLIVYKVQNPSKVEEHKVKQLGYSAREIWTALMRQLRKCFPILQLRFPVELQTHRSL